MNKTTSPSNSQFLAEARHAGFIRQPRHQKATFRLALLLVFTAGLKLASAQTTAFNYTGYLLDGGLPTNGSNDLRFTLYATNSGGLPITNTLVITVTNQIVNNGIFVVALDFGGGAFDGNARWLEIAARPGGSANPFTNTFPRQPITAAPYAVYANNGVPVGSVMAYMGTNPPAGWLLCDGQARSRATYAALYAVIGNSSGSADGATNFNLPDLRGMFLRGVNGTRADGYADPMDNRNAPAAGGNSGNSIGSVQADQMQSHTHSFAATDSGFSAAGCAGCAWGTGRFTRIDMANNTSVTTQSAGGSSETRPNNAYVNYIIKY